MDGLFSVLAEPQQNLANRSLHGTKSVARNVVEGGFKKGM